RCGQARRRWRSDWEDPARSEGRCGLGHVREAERPQVDRPTEGVAEPHVVLIAPLTLTILAGGRGTRLGGVDKAALDLNGKPILEHQLPALGPLAREILVVANDDHLAADPRLTVVHDPDPHAGVLPALLAALEAATSDLMLLVACDMPFVSRRL